MNTLTPSHYKSNPLKRDDEWLRQVNNKYSLINRRVVVKQESLAIAKTTARCAQYMGGRPEKYRESSQTPPATFPKICKGFLFRSILRMCIQNLKFIALSVPEIIGVLKIFGQSLYSPTLQFLPNF